MLTLLSKQEPASHVHAVTRFWQSGIDPCFSVPSEDLATLARSWPHPARWPQSHERGALGLRGPKGGGATQGSPGLPSHLA